MFHLLRITGLIGDFNHASTLSHCIRSNRPFHFSFQKEFRFEQSHRQLFSVILSEIILVHFVKRPVRSLIFAISFIHYSSQAPVFSFHFVKSPGRRGGHCDNPVRESVLARQLECLLLSWYTATQNPKRFERGRPWSRVIYIMPSDACRAAIFCSVQLGVGFRLLVPPTPWVVVPRGLGSIPHSLHACFGHVV